MFSALKSKALKFRCTDFMRINRFSPINPINSFYQSSQKSFFKSNPVNYQSSSRMSEGSFMNFKKFVFGFNKIQAFSVSNVKKRRAKLPDPKYKMKTHSGSRKRFKIVNKFILINSKFLGRCNDKQSF